MILKFWAPTCQASASKNVSLTFLSTNFDDMHDDQISLPSKSLKKYKVCIFDHDALTLPKSLKELYIWCGLWSLDYSKHGLSLEIV